MNSDTRARVIKPPTETADEVTLRRFIDRRAKDQSRDRIRNPLLSLPVRHAPSREYLRDLRAAEMIAWEMTGGDYLISR